MRSLASVISSHVMPSPRSVTVTRTPRAVAAAEAATRVSGLENWGAFSRSPARAGVGGGAPRAARRGGGRGGDAGVRVGELGGVLEQLGEQVGGGERHVTDHR